MANKMISMLGVMVFILLVALCWPKYAAAERIAVAADSDGKDAAVSNVAARAPFVLVFDTDAGTTETFPRPVSAARRAGPALAGWLQEEKVDMFIAGRIGPKLEKALDSVEIDRMAKTGPVFEIVSELKGRFRRD
jgi:predicted Fe-Mo cluster-binding NifX family protein